MSQYAGGPPALMQPTPVQPGNDASVMMRYDANKRETFIAYLLWFFLGFLGAHRFYLGRNGSAAAILAISIVSLLLTVIAVGLIGFLVVWVWWLIDAFLIPGMTQGYNNRLIATLRA